MHKYFYSTIMWIWFFPSKLYGFNEVKSNMGATLFTPWDRQLNWKSKYFFICQGAIKLT